MQNFSSTRRLTIKQLALAYTALFAGFRTPLVLANQLAASLSSLSSQGDFSMQQETVMTAQSSSVERTLSVFAQTLEYEQIPQDVLKTVKNILLTVIGTAVAGAREEGVLPVRDLLLHRGGKSEATVWVFGDKLPATSAALVNGVMCRSLDYCDSIVPGLHIGSSLIPAALSAVELRGGCTGRKFLAAVTAGAELSARLNLTGEEYDGFDPTGIAGVFASTAAAARILDLSEAEMINALALAFNRCAGSFQSNVDGSLAVRLIQGWVAETGVSCALYAKRGLTGPVHFLDGVYGYMKLFSKNRRTAQSLIEGLGESYRLKETAFKKYPSCGATIGPTELALQIVQERKLAYEDISSIEVRVTPYCYKLVGHKFSAGSNPRVNAQFSIQYCVANAFVRGASKLRHFRESAIRSAEITGFLDKILVVSDPGMEKRGLLAVDLKATTVDGHMYMKSLDVSSVSPGYPLSDAEHRAHFDECIDYSESVLPVEKSSLLFETIVGAEHLDDVQTIVRHLVPTR